MLKRRKVARMLGRAVVVLLLIVPTIGCGDNREKIVRPDSPTPVPDESKRLGTDTEHAPTSQQEK